MKDLDPIEAAAMAGLALAWATVTVARLLLVPLLAVLIALLTPRRRPALQPAAVAPGAASSEVPAPRTATVEAVEPEAAVAPAEQALAPLTLATIATDLMELPAVELRKLTGCRRKVAKARMVEAWLAMPI